MPDLEERIPPEERDIARRVSAVRTLRLGRGPWMARGAEAEEADPPFAWLVVDGALTATVRMAARESARLLGPGDIVSPRRRPDHLLAVEVDFSALQPTTLAALDRRYLTMAQRWPGLTLALHERLAEDAVRGSVLTAIGHLPRVEMRVLALLWHLADRFGRMAPDAVVLPLALTHAQLGRLVGARRPTVTIALQNLRDAGDVARRADGTWWVSAASRDKLAAWAED
jgi:CRP/FNR family cyclic AMP-dependent transcriptional regulator